MRDYTPEREIELADMIDQFRKGAIFTDPHTGMDWEFLEDFPDGGCLVRKISNFNGSRTKTEWPAWKLKFELNRVIRGRIRDRAEVLMQRVRPLYAMKHALKTFLDTGLLYEDGRLYEPLIRVAAQGDHNILREWIESKSDLEDEFRSVTEQLMNETD